MDYAQLDGMIAELDKRANGMWLIKKDGEFWRETWALVKEIGEAFRETRYPSKEQKDRARHRFQSVVDGMKTKQEERSASSASLKSTIATMAEKACPFDSGVDAMAKAASGIMAIEIAGMMLKDAARALVGRSPETLDQRRRRLLVQWSDELHRVWAYFEAEKASLLPRDRTECFEVLRKAKSELDAAWTEFKGQKTEEHQQREEAFEHRRQRKRELINDMQSLIGDADAKDSKERSQGLMAKWREIGFAGRDHEDALWQEFKAALDQFWAAKKKGYARRLRERLQNQHQFLERLRGSIEHDEGVLEEKREKLSNVSDGRRADEIRDHLETAIASLEDKIQSKKEKAEQVEADIAEIESKLRDCD